MIHKSRMYEGVGFFPGPDGRASLFLPVVVDEPRVERVVVEEESQEAASQADQVHGLSQVRALFGRQLIAHTVLVGVWHTFAGNAGHSLTCCFLNHNGKTIRTRLMRPGSF